jgi:hypothetical protein
MFCTVPADLRPPIIIVVINYNKFDTCTVIIGTFGDFKRRDILVSIATSYMLEGRGLILPVARYFSILHSVQTGSKIKPASYPINIEGSFHKLAPDLSPPSSAVDKNGVIIPPLLHICSLRGA